MFHLPLVNVSASNAACGNGNPDHASANLVLIRRLSFLDCKKCRNPRELNNTIQSYVLT